jgi:hypothetical protein
VKKKLNKLTNKVLKKINLYTKKKLTVTGESILWTLLSSTKISRALLHNSLTSDSVISSQRRNFSICLGFAKHKKDITKQFMLSYLSRSDMFHTNHDEQNSFC